MQRFKNRSPKLIIIGVLTATSLLVISSLVIISITIRFPMEKLDEKSASALMIYDSNGNLLRRETYAGKNKETWVALREISPHLINAAIASEDNNFYKHGGIDWPALARALWLNIQSLKVSYGGSTISMQLTRLATDIERTLWGKFKQILLTKSLERKLSKKQILEHYLNMVYYGNGVYGAESAARFYFRKSANELSVGESALLAVIPRGPGKYNPFLNRNEVDIRWKHILGLMVKHGYIDQETHDRTIKLPLSLAKDNPDSLAPHFVDYVKERLPKSFNNGVNVITTLDLPLQRRLELIVANHVDSLTWRNLTQASVVVMRNRDGAVLAMIGSRNYWDRKNKGAFNGVTAILRPGSTLKPFVYGASFEKGDTPATIAYDVILPNETHAFYSKDVRSHGFARYREALAGSYNLSAVHTLQRVGIKTVLNKLRTAGLTTLNKPDELYDWGLAIGHADARLLDLATAFTTFGRGGKPIMPKTVQEARRRDGAVWREKTIVRERVFSEEISYLIFDILSDPDARRPMFGDSVPMNLPFPVALKTGTTRALTDLWAFGVTKEYTVGVWAGNFNGEPTAQVRSVQGATPLISEAYSAIAAEFGMPSAPNKPSGIVTASVCPVSGMRPGPYCSHKKQELFLKNRLPNETCDWHQMVCGEVAVVYPKPLVSWAAAMGKGERTSCDEVTIDKGVLRIISPINGAKFVIESHRPLELQRPPLVATFTDSTLNWLIDNEPADKWIPCPGKHRIHVTDGNNVDSIEIFYEE